MNKLGKNAWISMGVGATAGVALAIVLVYKERKRRAQILPQNNMSGARVCNSVDGPSTDVVTTRVTGLLARDSMVGASESSSGALVLGAGQALLQDPQMEVRLQLEEVLQCVAGLREEVADLRNGLQGIAVKIVQEVKMGMEESQKAARRRRHFLPRDRTDSMSSSSVYFTASGVSLYDGESEGGYTTANPESDYNGDTDKEPEENSEEEEEEEESCASVCTLKQDSLEEQEQEVLPEQGLAHLLSESDVLHSGGAREKAEGFQLLQTSKPLYGESKDYLWRLARAYHDMYETTVDQEEKKFYAEQGRDEAEAALQKDDLSAECHKWFAVLTGLTSHHDTMHGKLKSSHVFKEHIDRAIALNTDDPRSYSLLGRWCYEVSSLGWLEKKAAAALYETPPTATLQEALDNFLKAEELSPGLSKTTRLYIAKCHRDLGNLSEARYWAQLASKTPSAPDEDHDSAGLEEELESLRN